MTGSSTTYVGSSTEVVTTTGSKIALVCSKSALVGSTALRALATQHGERQIADAAVVEKTAQKNGNPLIVAFTELRTNITNLYILICVVSRPVFFASRFSL